MRRSQMRCSDISPPANRTAPRWSASSTGSRRISGSTSMRSTRRSRARQGGYGRGGRMKIESDEIEFLAGVRGSETLGSPIAVAGAQPRLRTPTTAPLMDPITGCGRAAHQSAARPCRLRGRAQVPPARFAQRARAGERARDRHARRAGRDLRAVSRGARHARRVAYVASESATSLPTRLDDWIERRASRPARCAAPIRSPRRR